LLGAQFFKKYDLILIPGLASGDFSGLEYELVSYKTRPKHAVDLALFFNLQKAWISHQLCRHASF